LTVSDLRPIVGVIADALKDRNQIDWIVSRSGLRNVVRLPTGQVYAGQLWQAAFEAALDAPPETLAGLLEAIRDSLGSRSKDMLEQGLREVGLSCVSRITRASNPELGDQAEALLAASSVLTMEEAAQRLRLTAFSVRRLLTNPLLADAYLRLAPSLLDPERRRMELADLAVDVITAVDYLLGLLETSASASPQLIPASDDFDRLARRRMDARQTAVRLGMHLISGLRSSALDL
jgi:hypothetical protein